MSEIRTTKSLEAMSASLNRALAGARAPQVVAAHRAQRRGPASSPVREDDARLRRAREATATLAARSRTNMLIGTLDRLRHPATGWRANRAAPPA
ncbi:hypothetical protein [Frankia sp. R82]|uniref:hypothetical protein n=1 Tax=Frankia sp. R82 TaxID=2950553 RepID=UPI0020440D84|nr:hypothetical protein [Frankia sp. R82]MCM3886841.1 hypothetical protein [Frankia sp. R82]